MFYIKYCKILIPKNADNLCRLTLTCNWHQVTCVCKQIKFKPALVCEITKNSFLHILLIFFILIFPTKHYILKCEFDVYAPLPLSKYNRFKSWISIQKKIFSPFKTSFRSKIDFINIYLKGKIWSLLCFVVWLQTSYYLNGTSKERNMLCFYRNSCHRMSYLKIDHWSGDKNVQFDFHSMAWLLC